MTHQLFAPVGVLSIPVEASLLSSVLLCNLLAGGGGGSGSAELWGCGWHVRVLDPFPSRCEFSVILDCSLSRW